MTFYSLASFIFALVLLTIRISELVAKCHKPKDENLHNSVSHDLKENCEDLDSNETVSLKQVKNETPDNAYYVT